MTPFRRRLESIKRSHEGERYPGDLALELLAPRPRRVAWMPVALAAAACLVVGVFLSRLLWPTPAPRQVVVVQPPAPVAATTGGEEAEPLAPARPGVPYVSLSLPSRPAFPSLEDVALAYEEADFDELNEPEDLQ